MIKNYNIFFHLFDWGLKIFPTQECQKNQFSNFDTFNIFLIFISFISSSSIAGLKENGYVSVHSYLLLWVEQTIWLQLSPIPEKWIFLIQKKRLQVGFKHGSPTTNQERTQALYHSAMAPLEGAICTICPNLVKILLKFHLKSEIFGTRNFFKSF